MRTSRCRYFFFLVYLVFLPFLPVSIQFLTNASVRRDGRKTSFAACCEASLRCMRRTVHRPIRRHRRERREERANPFASRHSSPETTTLIAVIPEEGNRHAPIFDACSLSATPFRASASRIARGLRGRASSLARGGLEKSKFHPETSPSQRVWRTFAEPRFESCSVVW